MLPLIARLQHESLDNSSASVAAHSRRLAALTTDNTASIRFKLDFDSLSEATAPQYSACFTAGAWYRRGLPPTQSPPASGSATCSDSVTNDCWGICQAADLITAEGRQIMVDVVTSLAPDISNLLAVRPVAGNLQFEVNEGSYQRAIIDKGWTPLSACASDCTTLSQVAVAEAYCTGEGAGAVDAVLSVRKPPVISGVAGTGSHCQTDADGRPTWLVFEWISSVANLDPAIPTATHVANYRALIYHELLHALGFSNSMFQNARNSAGERKNLLKLKQVTDTDGSTDEIWHFEKGRAFEMGSKYFNCVNSSDWLGVPLMGLPELGRASHWETRVLRDDVMSYGGRDTVSSITLAAMEDLGFYLADYSRAGCMSWGYQQGCTYVTSRCGVGFNDRTAIPGSSSECSGDPYWGSNPDSYLTEKCAGGSTPCASLVGSGFTSAGATLQCNAQCYTVSADRTDCSAAPSSEVDGAETPSLFGFSVDEHLAQYALLGVWALAFVVFIACCRRAMCPRGGSVRAVVYISTFLLLVGGALAGFGAYAYWWDTQHTALFKEYVGSTTLRGAIVSGAVLVALPLICMLGICFRSPCPLLLAWFTYLLLLLGQIFITVLLLYWVHSLDDVTSDTLNTLRGSSGGRHSGSFGAVALAEAEAFTCRAYQKCCRDPQLNAISSGTATCLDAHEGTATDVALAFEDVSSVNFCPYVSGGRSTVEPATGVCHLLEFGIDGFSLPSCQHDFCTLGIDGYFDFVNKVVGFLRNYGVLIGGFFAAWTLWQLVLIVNLYSLRKRYKRARQQNNKIQPEPAEGAAPTSADGAEPNEKSQVGSGDATEEAKGAPAVQLKPGVQEAWASDNKLDLAYERS